ncbi:BQ5605_C002g01216 [Microbotryum silenes-dioicae]|uniref:BQ5605_C002g01216 protein n=1 Tax=Microbotryum silenes-dioicae TaxID=796604 RepID=A0A2X0LY21_9BASI|nr:BQ5605_C002g01216 [Microbotryum silenes-dioicae]
MSSTPLNFAPYSEPPDVSKARWAPPAPSSTSSYTPQAQPPQASTSYQSGAPISSLGANTSFSSAATPGFLTRSLPGGAGGALSTGTETTLGYRYDYEGPMAYALGPFGAVGLLVLEVENDWVRFHAWQSVLLTGVLVSLHLIWAVWGLHLLASIQLLVECAVFILLTWQTYRDADLLDRYELPWIGRIANQWVEAE